MTKKYQPCDKVVGETFPEAKTCGRPAELPAHRCDLHPVKNLWPGEDDAEVQAQLATTGWFQVSP